MTIDAKLYNEFIVKRSPKIKNNRSEVIQWDCSKEPQNNNNRHESIKPQGLENKAVIYTI